MAQGDLLESINHSFALKIIHLLSTTYSYNIQAQHVLLEIIHQKKIDGHCHCIAITLHCTQGVRQGSFLKILFSKWSHDYQAGKKQVSAPAGLRLTLDDCSCNSGNFTAYYMVAANR